jgi:cytoskeletal protein CcmA (bactofilin family)
MSHATITTIRRNVARPDARTAAHGLQPSRSSTALSREQSQMSDTMETVRRTASMSLFRTGVTSAAQTPATLPVTAPTVLSANAEMKGSITTTDTVEINGKLEGDVRAKAISVCVGGIVKGDLTAETIVIQGKVDGRIQAQDVRLAAGAEVSGEIAHGSLGIDTAANFEGSIKRLANTAPTA